MLLLLLNEDQRVLNRWKGEFEIENKDKVNQDT
jgi:hypothetical protein